jgi:hypothetical protein
MIACTYHLVMAYNGGYKTAHDSNTQHGLDTWNVKRYIYMLLKYNCFVKISFIKNKNDERNYNNVSFF